MSETGAIGQRKREKSTDGRRSVEVPAWVKDERVRSLLREAKMQVSAWRYPEDHPYVRLIKCVEWLLKPKDDESKREA